MRQEKKKIVLNPDQSGLANLGAAFGSLNFSLAETSREPDKPETHQGKSADEKKTRRGRVLLRKETAHRGGKIVIVVYDFPETVTTPEIENLGRLLKNLMECGGTSKDRRIEIQGDHPAKIRLFLEKEGFEVKGLQQRAK